MFQRLFSACALGAALALLVSCSTLDRMQRLDAEHALQRVNYLNPDAVNLWPFFFASGDYVSVLWPMADWDNRGFAIRPLVNKENQDWSLLFPLAGWDSGNGNGWCAIGYWFPSSRTYGVFPIFHYSGNTNFFYAGPFWGSRQSGGFFPIVWVHSGEYTVFPIAFIYDNSTTVFPLFYADKNKFLSFPYSYASKPANQKPYWWHAQNSPTGFNGWKKELDWRWYTSILWYGGHNDLRLIDARSPEAEYAEAMLWDYNDKQKHNLHMRDKGTAGDRHTVKAYIEEKVNAGGYDAREVWYGLFPFFHYETFRDLKKGPSDSDPYLFNSFGGLLGCVKRTPEQDLTHVLGPVGCLRNVTRVRGKSAMESRDTDSLWSALLFHTQEDSRREMKPEAEFHFRKITRDLLERRLALYIDKDIREWEKEFANEQENVMRWHKVSYVPCGTYNRPLYRIKPIPVPKTRQEVEKLLAKLDDPKNYTAVREKSTKLIPFYSHEVNTRDDAVSTDTRLLLGLLSCFKQSKYKAFEHILGPFAYLHSVTRKEGEYEREKARDEFSMSLLAYWLSKDRWEITKEASARYNGVAGDNLRHRIVLEDKKEIAEWEQNFRHRLDAESELTVPKTAEEARTLLNEMNDTSNYVLNHETGYGVAPFFAHRKHRNLTDTGVLLDLLFRYKRSPRSDVTHLLGPVVFYSSRTSNDPDYLCQKRWKDFFVSLLYYRGSDNHYSLTPDAKKKLRGVNPYELRRRFRMVDPKEIAEWERGQNAEYWFADPIHPRKVSATAAEVKALYKEYFDMANYEQRWEKYMGVLPFFHVAETNDSKEFNLFAGLLSAWETSPRKERFHVLGSFGYGHEKTTSAPDTLISRRHSKDATAAFLCFASTEDSYVPTRKFEQETRDLPEDCLDDRIRMGAQCDAKKLAEWTKDFEIAVWRRDPRSNRSAPSLEEAKKLFLAYRDPANYRKQTRETWGMIPFLHREKSDTCSKVLLFLSLLSAYEKESGSQWMKSVFHVLGPVFLRKSETKTGHFAHDGKDEQFTLAGLLAYHNRESQFVRSPAGEKQMRYLHKSFVDTLMNNPLDKYAGKCILQGNTRLDGFTAVSAPKSRADVKKLWLDYNADGNFLSNPYESFGFFPLFHFGSDTLGRTSKCILPPLLSWYTKDTENGVRTEKTNILMSLLYYGSTREKANPLHAEWIADLPGAYEIHSSEKPFLEGDLEFEQNSFSGSTSRYLLIAGNNRGRALFWKKGSPEELGGLYKHLSDHYIGNIDKTAYYTEKDRQKDLADLKKLGLDVKKTETWLGRAQLRKQILDKWAEVRDMSERGRLGRLVYRYARCGDDAAFWLVGGLLGKYTRQDGTEDTSVLGFLYRSHKDAKSSARIIFPFIASSEDESGSQFSFLWRLVNVKKSKDGNVSGHLMFIPF